jgi:hypothetical protein
MGLSMNKPKFAALIVAFAVSTPVLAMPVFPWQPITTMPYDPAEGCLYGGERYDEGEVIDPLLAAPHECVLKPVDPKSGEPVSSSASTNPLFLFWEEIEDQVE